MRHTIKKRGGASNELLPSLKKSESLIGGVNADAFERELAQMGGRKSRGGAPALKDPILGQAPAQMGGANAGANAVLEDPILAQMGGRKSRRKSSRVKSRGGANAGVNALLEDPILGQMGGKRRSKRKHRGGAMEAITNWIKQLGGSVRK